VHELTERGIKRVEYCPWFRDVIIANGEDILDVTYFADEAWFQLSGYVNSRKQPRLVIN
jgi:hypothetical protein